MPEWWPLQLLLVFWGSTGQIFAMHVEGTTASDMRFSGEILGMEDSVIKINSPENENSLQVGIPLEIISSLKMLHPPSGTRDLLDQMESLLPLLSLWDSPSMEHIISAVHESAGKNDWQQVFLWSVKLGRIIQDPRQLQKLNLLKAWALFEMKIFDQAGIEAKNLSETMDPLMAPVRLCWLNAQLAQRSGSQDQALFWALLPSLQIPAHDGKLVEELKKLANSLEDPSPTQADL